jgi:predicted DsbA family dithiol-disulfide isomerase
VVLSGVQIELWSDYACPWCALGLYRLEQAREQFDHGNEITVVHRAFELDPGAPAARTQTMGEMLSAKYGMRPEQITASHAQMAELGRQVGFEFNFERAQLGNTFDAHRVTRLAQGTPGEEALVRRLFTDYFTEGRLLSDHDTLVEAATASGLEEAPVRALLESDHYAEDVRADEAAARSLDVNGVPFFLINGKWPVPGAQDVETLLLLLQRAWERTEVTAT